MNKKSNRDTAPVRREIPSLSAKNHISKNQGWLPRRIAPRQPLSISLNVKLGGVFWTKFEHSLSKTPTKEASLTLNRSEKDDFRFFFGGKFFLIMSSHFLQRNFSKKSLIIPLDSSGERNQVISPFSSVVQCPLNASGIRS